MFLEEIEIKSCYATRGVSDNAGQPLANPRLVGARQYKDEHARGKQAHLNSAYRPLHGFPSLELIVLRVVVRHCADQAGYCLLLVKT